MNNLLNIFVSITLSLILLSSAGGIVLQQQQQQVNAQNVEESQTSTTTGEDKIYILVFGHRTVGNIDNSTKIVSAIVGNNSVKIEEEFLEELSLAPSQQLEQQIEKIVNDGINGTQCNASLTTQQGETVNVDCISSGNNIIWYIYSAK
jgi:predicted peroxiredoxin